MQQTIVIKIGSSSLTTVHGELNRDRIEYFAGELSKLQSDGNQVLLVTSGAVAAGFSRIGYKNRPKILHEKQASAAVGQALLMQSYNEALGKYGISPAQILLTRTDFSDRKRGHNALMTIRELLHHRIIPIINENDTVSVDELRFGDNDMLSALVANFVKAGKLIIITDTDGLYTEDPRKNAEAKRIALVGEINEDILRIAGGSGSQVGTGGMRSKIEAARVAVRGGVPVFIGKAEQLGDLTLALQGEGKGTYFSTTSHTLSAKKQWIGFHSTPIGKIEVDPGAEHAILTGGKSLLPAGVKKVQGDFHPGDVIEVLSQNGILIGRGVVNYESKQLLQVMGLSTDEAQKIVDVHRLEVIHRDDWIQS